MFAWLRRPITWWSDLDTRHLGNLPYIGLPPQRWEPPPAAPVTPRPIPANLPKSHGNGVVFSSVVEQIDMHQRVRQTLPPIDSTDTLRRPA